MSRTLRMGMVGGGCNAFIGAVHRFAARLDGRIDLVCGAFSSNPEDSRKSGELLQLDENRVYGCYPEMFAAEAALPRDQRMDFVSIVTPNNLHYPVAAAALDAGFHVVCDKPMTTTLAEALALERKVEESGRLFCLTHNYSGYPMVREARDLAKGGHLGALRRVVVEYAQGWMASPLEKTGQKQATWRVDPAQAGDSFTMGDIGVHCANLAEFVTGLQIEELCAELNTFGADRQLDDDGSMLLHFSQGARGVLWASSVAVGEENNLSIRVYGEKGSVAWRQEEPNTLVVHWLDRPTEIRRTASAFVGASARSCTRLPVGHPEGFIEAFANIYSGFADAVELREQGMPVQTGDLPDVHDGVRGVAFIGAAVRSAKSAGVWTSVNVPGGHT